MAASTAFFDESDASGGSHSGIARQNRLSETRLFVEDLVGCLLDDPNNVSLIRSRISSQPPMNSQTRSVLVNMLVERLNGDSGPIVAATVSQSQPPHANVAPTGSVSDPLAWLMGSLVVSSFGNDNLAKSLDIVTEALLKKNSDAKYVKAANVVALIAKVALAFGLFFGMWLGHVWAFKDWTCTSCFASVPLGWYFIGTPCFICHSNQLGSRVFLLQQLSSILFFLLLFFEFG